MYNDTPREIARQLREEAEEIVTAGRDFGYFPRTYWTGPYEDSEGTFYARWEEGWDEVVEIRRVEGN